MFNQIARFSVRWRWLIIVVWIAAVPLAIKTLPSISSVSKNDNSQFLPASSPTTKANQLEGSFRGKGATGTSTMVASRQDGPLTKADNEAITRATNNIKHRANVKFVQDQGLSKDGQAREALIGTSVNPTGTEANTVVDQIRADFKAAQAPSGLNFHLAGLVAQTVDSNNASKSGRSNTTIYSVVLIIVLLLIVFRSALAPIITLLPAGLSLALAGPVIAESTKIGVQVSALTQILLVVILLGAGTDYGLFLVFRVREELRGGLSPKEAVTRALTKVGESISFSASTVIAALLCLLLASFGLYKGLGPSLAIGLVIMLLAALTFLPALLAVLGRAVFWPTKTDRTQAQIGVWGRLADQVIKKPVVTLGAGAIIFAGLMLGLIGLNTTGFSSNSAPPEGSDSAIGQKVIAQHFPAASNNPQDLILKFNQPIWGNLVAAYQAQQKLSASNAFTAISGPFNPGGASLTPDQLAQLHSQLGPAQQLPVNTPADTVVTPELYQAYRTTSQFISPDGKLVQYYGVLSAGTSGSTAAMKAVPQERKVLADIATSVKATDSAISSTDAVSYDVAQTSNSDLARVIPVVLVLIAILLAVLLRSLVAPLYLIITVALSYLAALGVAMIIFVHIGSNTGLNFVVPFVLFIFAMALGEDYNILVMSRIREEAHQSKTLRAAVTKAIGITGNTVTSAGLVLAGTFLVLGTVGGNELVREIGFSVAAGILLDTFFVRTLLVPSIVTMLGRWNWWPSKLGRTTK